MRRTLAALAVAVMALTACGDDSDDSDDDSASSASTTTQAAEPTDDTTDAAETDAAETDSETGAGADVGTFCNEYRSAMVSAENRASTEQFEGLTPPDELADVWQDYLNHDFDAGLTVDEFVAGNCFEE